tara:strand:+ start:169 stop:411 length:243 start_codon:yes stop_codon:yes gene_type:complete
MMMRLFILILTGLLPTLTVADTISITVPSAVADVVKKYRADCAEDGGELELDGDEMFRLRTEEGEQAFPFKLSTLTNPCV